MAENTIIKEAGRITGCTCGAKCDGAGEEKRFTKRHPAKCNARKAFARQLAQGTRCVSDQENQESRERFYRGSRND